jgi:hypothetical protein
MLRYAGIGRRSTPLHMQSIETQFATKMEKLGWCLHSGGADGSDKAFELGVEKNKEIFKARKAEAWAYEELKHCLPAYIRDIETLPSNIKSTIARNMMIILGRNGDTPVSFVLCFADGFDSGGTGYGYRCAMRHNIPVFNLYDGKILTLVEIFIENDATDFLAYMKEKMP